MKDLSELRRVYAAVAVRVLCVQKLPGRPQAFLTVVAGWSFHCAAETPQQCACTRIVAHRLEARFQDLFVHLPETLVHRARGCPARPQRTCQLLLLLPAHLSLGLLITGIALKPQPRMLLRNFREAFEPTLAFVLLLLNLRALRLELQNLITMILDSLLQARALILQGGKATLRAGGRIFSLRDLGDQGLPGQLVAPRSDKAMRVLVTRIGFGPRVGFCLGLHLG
mmetsp:Transcript_30643/g.57255  ORF Transcript_30643/g.57255 Transcript_30643/m.57255 type:complete len:225 (-) Transcript_30643:488-1162(-)